jgi:2-dehydro-3-deoxyphosphogluconate aldolase/(4S)-4-hydroxy-2-oxoglutarate aldolase
MGGCIIMENMELTFELAHVGINCANSDEALSVANLFGILLNTPVKIGNSSIFTGSCIEATKSPYLGTKGHLAIRTNNIKRAIEEYEKKGFEIDMSTQKTDGSGNITSVYLRGEFGGFAVHLLA